LNGIWSVSGRETNEINSKREKEIHAFAAANGWLATILDPGIRVTFKQVGI